MLFYLVVFVAPVVSFTLLALRARRNGPPARVAAGVLGLLGTVCAALLVVGLGETFAGIFAIGVLLVLGLGLMAVSILSRGTQSDPAVARCDVAAAPFKRMRPWPAVAVGLGAVLVFAGSARQSRAHARTDGRTSPLSVDRIEQPPAPRNQGRARVH